VRGEIEKTDDGVIVVRRIHVRYRLQADPGKRGVIDRVLSFHVAKCPVARTLEGAVEITTELELAPAQPATAA
jgi:uncharacterized OsmC-like protein